MRGANVLALAVAMGTAAACGSGSPSASTTTPIATAAATTAPAPTPSWVTSAERWLDAYVAAWNGGIRWRLERFLARDVELVWSGFGAVAGRDEVVDALGGWWPWSGYRLSVTDTFLGDGVAVLSGTTAAEGEAAAAVIGGPTTALLVQAGPGGARRHVVLAPLADEASWHRRAGDVDPALDARRRDLLERAQRAIATHFAAATVGSVTTAAGDVPAVFAAITPFPTTVHAVVALVAVHAGPAAVVWPSGEALLSAAGHRGAQLAWGTAAGADWPRSSAAWSGVAVPSFDPVPAGVLRTAGGHTVRLFNADADQRRLVEWALARFEAGGLGAPPVEQVVFPPTDDCERGAGWSLREPEGPAIQLCYADVVGGDGRLTLPARRTALHELAHVWEEARLDDPTRLAFLTRRGLSVWWEPDAQWSSLGAEHAAEVLAWGLMDDPVSLRRIGRDSCAELQSAYRLLTGRSPLGDCP